MAVCALIVTDDGFRSCPSKGVEPLAIEPLLTMAGAPEGTAGGAGLPFTGDTELDFPCCAGPPTIAGGVLDAIGGAPEGLPLVALA